MVDYWLPRGADWIDIAIVTFFGWIAIGALRRSRGRPALVGLGVLAIVYGAARAFDLRLAASLFQAFFAAAVVILAVLFQDDWRRLLEGLGTWRPGAARPRTEGASTRDLLVRCVTRLAAMRCGALIVLPRQDLLDLHLEGGIALGGALSEPLLLSLFDASSPGHDGAVVIRNDRVERFAVHLPLSANHEGRGSGGTRHAAALGLAERCDALVIVVSEERGTVSIARNGLLRTLAQPESLVTELDDAGDSAGEAVTGDRRWRSLRDAGVAAAIAVALWAVVIPGATPSEMALSLPVEVQNLPPDLTMRGVEPEQVTVTLRGTRRDLWLARSAGLQLRIDGYLARLGRRTFTLSPSALALPAGVDLVSLEPDRIRLDLEELAPSGGG